MSAGDTSLHNKKINNLIIRNPNRKQSCPLTVVNSKTYEPRLDSLISRKTTLENGRNGSSSYQEVLSSSSHDWLKPGLSLPKFRGKDDIIEEVRESIRREREIGSGEGSLSEVLPVEDVVHKKDDDDVRSEVPTENYFPPIDIVRPNVTVKSRKSIDGFSECPSNIYMYSSGIDSFGINANEDFQEKADEERRALKNWELWMRRRKKQHEVLCQKTKREPPDLVMNRGVERFKKVKEDKTPPQNSRIPEPDKGRTSPSFFNSGDRLFHGHIPQEYIKTEKYEDEGITSEGDFLEISKDPSIPSIHIQEEGTEAPGHSIISDKVFQCCYPKVDVDRESTVCLAINNTELKCVYYAKTSELFMADTDISEWSLIFETSPIGTLQTKTLNIENRGTMAIRYHWISKKPYSNPVKYPKLTRDNHAPWFYFDKNPGIFLPGQKYDLNFYHFSHTPGLHVETWVLQTIPLLFNPPTEIKIVLVGISDYDYSLKDLLAIDSYINKCVAESLAKEIVDEIFERAFRPPAIEIDYESFFMEEELFKYQNPRHHYHSEIVKELKNIFSEINLDPPQKWDFNLLNLRALIELKMEGEEKRSRICRVNDLARALLKPSFVRHKPEGKYHFVYSFLCKVANQIENDALRLKASMPDIPVKLKKISENKAKLQPDERDEVRKIEEQDKDAEIQDLNLDQIKSSNYYQCLYIQVYHQLCLAAEQIVSIIESCKLFEHHGEIEAHHDKEQQDVSRNLLNYCMLNSISSATLKEKISRTTQ